MDQQSYNPWGTADDDFKAAQEKLKRLQKRWSGPAGLGVLIAVLALWLLSGIYMVGPGEVGVVRQFGREIGQTTAGLRYRLPYPIQTHDIVDVANVRRAEIGYRTGVTQGRSTTRRVDQEALMLTGDENIVEAQMIVQYVVQDPSAYLFNVNEPEQVLHSATEVAIRSIVGRNTIDYVMTEGRVELQAQVREYLQNLLDLYGTGLLAQEVRFTVVDAPDQVREAFHDVVRALEDRGRQEQQAQAYREDVVPRSRGEAAEMVRQAEAYREQRVIRARGDANRFLQVLEEYHKAEDVTRQRMYLEAMESILPGAEKFIMSQGAEGVLPFLPLTSQTMGGR